MATSWRFKSSHPHFSNLFFEQKTMDLTEAIKKHQPNFGLVLKDEQVSNLAIYYDLVMKYNDELHLVGKCDAEEFAIRHILESLYALQFLPDETTFADVGAGAGLPSIPLLIVREGLLGKLVESKKKKGTFLAHVIRKCNLKERAVLINEQFQEVSNINVSFVTCRALDKFSRRVLQIKKWSDDAEMILFAGNAIRQELKKRKLNFEEHLIPMSERRFIFRVTK